MLSMVLNDNAGHLTPPRCSQVHREHARSYRGTQYISQMRVGWRAG